MICSHCGVLCDPTQIIIDNESSSHGFGQHYGLEFAGRALMRADGASRQGFQTEEVRRDMIKATRHKLIRDLLFALNRRSDSLSYRAEHLFDTVHKRAHFAWGSTRAEDVAACCVSIVLREATLPESLRELAILTSRPLPRLARVYRKVKHLLGLQLSLTDPHLHFPTLISHIRTTLDVRLLPSLPATTTDLILSAPQECILEWARRLLNIATDNGLVHGRHVGAVACAVVLLAFEAEAEIRLQGLEVLAGLLGSRLGKRASTVLKRYSEIVKLLSFIKTQLQHRHPEAFLSLSNGIASTSRMRWLKDVLILIGEASGSELDAGRWPILPYLGHKRNNISDSVSLAYDEPHIGEDDVECDYWCQDCEDDGDTSLDSPRSNNMVPVQHITEGSNHMSSARPAYIRTSRLRQTKPKLEALVIRAATTFLAPMRGIPDPEGACATRRLLLQSDAPLADVGNVLLSGTRLSRLAAERGGQHLVQDDELFCEGELESYLQKPSVAE
ncbi:hypothetical protein DACRYDRAFT_113496 [Dacryopinax primogenitus]|uniref:Uncharacterized protein n=1 Tax=Dacryopinax primogenitus (strain DJM 731) TaxID=1858805 RepID=M5GAH0_DACPD|nr:uncharacterized protein DACRYDRAFT_113496 [Dacryopinax primogenitus]EJU05350.1 hypothetical protein DACRYDRAFT_113496 [Dacryopinax primogenitus]